MNLSLGIVGLPNVGKSTLFNALTSQSVPAENYPFCTIDPNIGVVAVHDNRLNKIAEISKPAKIVPAVVEFVDIAGLVKGAANGEGLGNKFLSHIKAVSAIVHVVRAYENTNVTHVENSIDPIRDIELINTELILKDLETLENRIRNLASRAKLNSKVAEISDYLKRLMAHLESLKLGITFNENLSEAAISERKSLFLLTDKQVIYLINANENKEIIKKIEDFVAPNPTIVMDIKLESDLVSMDNESRTLFMKELGVEQTGLERLTTQAYKLLNLISFFTEGPTEVRAWTIEKGSTAPVASSVIHTDFQKNFIAMEIVKYPDFVQFGGWNKARENGKLILGGKTYIVEDGDIVIVKHNA